MGLRVRVYCRFGYVRSALQNKTIPLHSIFFSNRSQGRAAQRLYSRAALETKVRSFNNAPGASRQLLRLQSSATQFHPDNIYMEIFRGSFLGLQNCEAVNYYYLLWIERWCDSLFLGGITPTSFHLTSSQNISSGLGWLIPYSTPPRTR